MEGGLPGPIGGAGSVGCTARVGPSSRVASRPFEGTCDAMPNSLPGDQRVVETARGRRASSGTSVTTADRGEWSSMVAAAFTHPFVGHGLKQGTPKRAPVLRTTLGPLGQILHDDRTAIGSGTDDARATLLERRGCIVNLLNEERYRVRGLERRPPSQHLIEHRRDEINISRPGADPLAQSGLGRDVPRRAENKPFGGRRRRIAAD